MPSIQGKIRRNAFRRGASQGCCRLPPRTAQRGCLGTKKNAKNTNDNEDEDSEGDGKEELNLNLESRVSAGANDS